MVWMVYAQKVEVDGAKQETLAVAGLKLLEISETSCRLVDC